MFRISKPDLHDPPRTLSKGFPLTWAGGVAAAAPVASVTVTHVDVIGILAAVYAHDVTVGADPVGEADATAEVVAERLGGPRRQVELGLAVVGVGYGGG